MTVESVHDAKVLKHLISLAQVPYQFLSLYLPVEVGQTTTESLRVRIKDALDHIEKRLESDEDKDLLKAFRSERQRIDTRVDSLRPDGPSLAVFSAQESDTFIAYWLPRSVRKMHVHYGIGASILPLLDMLDEFEPVALAFVEKEKARILVFEAGIIESDERFSYAVVPFSAPGPAEHKARGHVEKELTSQFEEVTEALEKRHNAYPFRRLFLSGTTDVLTVFKGTLPKSLEKTLAGDLGIDFRKTDGVIKNIVLEAAEKTERQDEEALLESLVTRALKNDLAVLGLAAVLGELNLNRVQLLVLTMDVPDEGRRCDNCHIILTAESARCPRCGGETLEADLQAELPILAMRQGADIEVVHGKAAEKLNEYQGAGAVQRFVA